MGVSPNKIYVGDCIEKLAEVEPNSVDLVFADPPFNIGYEYDVYDDRRSREEYLAWSKRWMSGVHRCLKDSGTFWLAIGDEFAAELKVAAQYDIGFHCRSWVIWYYTFGVNCARGFSRSHTHLFHFVKDPSDFVFNGDNPLVRVASARQLVYADARANPKGRLPDNTWIFRPQDIPSGFAPSHDTWYFARVAGTFKERQGFHGCQMPEQLLGRIIRISSNPLDVVLDPFSGSGTTLAVAKKLGRQWMGFELSEDYGSRIEERLRAIHPGDDLDGSVNPLASAPATRRGKSKIRTRNGRPVPLSDKALERSVLAAFESTCNGFSADYVLCEPELGSEFLKECRRLRLAGTEFVWNRILLRMRKSGRLSKSNRQHKRIAFTEMDTYRFASEIALRLLEIDFGVTLDDILCLPEATLEFDRMAQQFAPGRTPFEYRWAALSIRKRAVQSKSLAIEEFADWQAKELPRAKIISEVAPSLYEGAGAYILASPFQTLYVGESGNVRARVEQLVDKDSWKALGLTTIRFVPGDASTLHGLQAALIGRLNPLLNTELLQPGHRSSDPRPLAQAVVL